VIGNVGDHLVDLVESVHLAVEGGEFEDSENGLEAQDLEVLAQVVLGVDACGEEFEPLDHGGDGVVLGL